MQQLSSADRSAAQGQTSHRAQRGSPAKTHSCLQELPGQSHFLTTQYPAKPQEMGLRRHWASGEEGPMARRKVRMTITTALTRGWGLLTQCFCVPGTESQVSPAPISTASSQVSGLIIPHGAGQLGLRGKMLWQVCAGPCPEPGHLHPRPRRAGNTGSSSGHLEGWQQKVQEQGPSRPQFPHL